MRSLGVAALLFALMLSGCASDDAVRPEDIPHMVDQTKGAITGDIQYRDGRPVVEHRVQVFDQENDVYCQVETQYDGKFYCQKLWPGTYRVSINMKDWPDCTVQVVAGKFTNLTIKQPTYSAQGMAGGCMRRT